MEDGQKLKRRILLEEKNSESRKYVITLMVDSNNYHNSQIGIIAEDGKPLGPKDLLVIHTALSFRVSFQLENLINTVMEVPIEVPETK